MLCLGAVVGTLAVTPVTIPVAAHAASACPSQLRPPAAQSATAPPWEQQRYDLARLDGIADGRGITVAVLDSGVAADQPQLRGRVLGGGDWVLDSDGRQDCLGHGTAVASIIAAAPSDGSRLRGVAPGVRILALRVTENSAEQGSSGRTGRPRALSQAVHAAVDAGARVINISMTVTASGELQEAIGYALARGTVVVAAAGNQHNTGGGEDPVAYPAGYPGVIAVASIGADGYRAATSQIGDYVQLAAPGEAVTGAVPTGGTALFAGTSFAAPFVAGTAALILQRFAMLRLTPAQVAARLYATADPAPDSGHSTSYGYGIVNPYRAVTAGWPAPAGTGTPGQPPAPAAAAPQGDEPDDSARAYAVTGVGVLVLGALLLLATALPRGTRRNWRPGGQ